MKNNNKPTTAKRKGSNQEPAGATPASGEIANPASADNQGGSKPEDKHWLEYAIFVFVVFTAFATFGACYYTRQQWLTADDSEKRQLRAYIGVSVGDLERFGEGAAQKFTITRKNYGVTPAYDIVVSSVGQAAIPIGQPILTLPNTPPPKDRFEKATLFPTMEMPLSINGTGVTMPAEQIAAIKAGQFHFIYYGVVNYRDAFNQPHYTRFCYMFKGQSMTSKDADICVGQNDSD